jgi:uncharacterized protein with GYD domain
MFRYITLLHFTPQGLKNIKRSAARAATFRAAAAKAGINVEEQYWTAGSCDGVLIFSAQDEAKAMRCLAALAAAGNVRTETLRAFNAKEFGAVAAKA